MRQEAMHAESGSTSKAPRIYVVTKLKTALAILGPSAVRIVLTPPSLAADASAAFF
jgi:hypothetical protein